VGDNAHTGKVRLAELVASLSLGIDLGFGQPMEHVLRQCLIALRIAERLGLSDESRAATYYTALLINVGCHADAHEQAKWFGDDLTAKASKFEHGISGLRATAAGMRSLGSGNFPLHRFRVGLEFAISSHREVDGIFVHHASLAEQLRLSGEVADAVSAAYEQWDGRGWPGQAKGQDVPMASRLSQLAEYTEVAHRVGGVDGATLLARKRSGKQFDPSLVTVLCDHAEDILGDLDNVRSWDAVIAAEPALSVVLTDDEFDAALLAIATFVDLKSPYTLGHSEAAGDLARAAGAALGLPAAELGTLRRAGLVCGFGRLGISNSIWDKRGPLGAGEWERVRMYPYFSERMLHQSGTLGPLGAIALQHRERLDGSGYPRGTASGAISRAARILGSADAYQAMREPRPQRPALAADEAAKELRAEVRAGRMDPEIVEAVLSGAGHRVRRRRDGVAGLTAREVEVLQLAARGMTTREIADQLVMSPKTVGNHIEHVYTKINAANRATASLFAVKHGLLPEDELVAAPFG